MIRYKQAAIQETTFLEYKINILNDPGHKLFGISDEELGLYWYMSNIESSPRGEAWITNGINTWFIKHIAQRCICNGRQYKILAKIGILFIKFLKPRYERDSLDLLNEVYKQKSLIIWGQEGDWSKLPSRFTWSFHPVIDFKKQFLNQLGENGIPDELINRMSNVYACYYIPIFLFNLIIYRKGYGLWYIEG